MTHPTMHPGAVRLQLLPAAAPRAVPPLADPRPLRWLLDGEDDLWLDAEDDADAHDGWTSIRVRQALPKAA